MLELKNIKKNYLSGEEEVKALRGINLRFRNSEFVSILGPSGCGKTTMLNIIGGLDRYSSGDLIINGKSTKDFKDRDWDSYRNFSVGFVFQNYNLISHQTILSNVELALTLSGVSLKERRKRALDVLEKVGLKDKINYKPNQLSGGQMQRVAIARALINDPDIILADEPTGALDSKTSEQVLELLQEVAKDKLVIMVTHNSTLAFKYSSRIIKILDGQIIDDSNPLEEDTTKELKTYGKTNMNYFTALSLSFNNLMTKKGRTFLTAFAGSIGIIGIALILSISTGVQDYIDRVEEETLSSYPIIIEESTIDFSSMMETMSGENKNKNTEKRKKNRIYSINIMNQIISILSNEVKNNNLEELRKYIVNEHKFDKYSNAITYNYNLNINIYKEDSNKLIQVNPSTVLDSLGAGEIVKANNSSSSVLGISSSSSLNNSSQLNVWTEMLDNEKLLKETYDLVKGRWPEKYNEVVLIVTEDNEISDYSLYTLGLKDQTELEGTLKKIQDGEKIEEDSNKSYKYDDFLNLSYKLIFNSDLYSKENGIYQDMRNNEEYMKKIVNEAEDIKVVGIIKPNSQSVMRSMQGGIGYTKELKNYVIEKSHNSEAVIEQINNPDINIFSGLKFVDGNNSSFDFSNLSFEEQYRLSQLSKEELAKVLEAYNNNVNATYEDNLIKLGYVDVNIPTSISIYPKDFESKEHIEKEIDNYNKLQKKNKKEENKISYSDVVGTMISSVSNIVDIISYVLIAFVTISLIVSSIMIGIITYISVLERTKEIGILRALGARKKDISRIFNAETLIIGFIAGLLGIIITILLNIPINQIIYNLSGVAVEAKLNIIPAILLILISVILTTIGGLIPSRIASKKDPVIALRTE